MDDASLCRFISQNRYGVISSAAPDGTPQSALVGVACAPTLEIIFDTLSATRKYRNLLQEPRCSVVVGWTGEQTLQIDGVAEELTGTRLALLQELYFGQWPECRPHLQWPGIAYFAVRPTWLRYSDYDQSPPCIWESFR